MSCSDLMPAEIQPTLPAIDKILKSAITVIQTEGLKKMSQAHVASVAGLRQSHLTYYFPKRKDLLKALVHTIHDEVKQSMYRMSKSLTSSPSSIYSAREFFVESVLEPTLAKLMLALMNLAEEDPSLQQWIVGFDNELIAQLRDLFAKLGMAPSDDALCLLHSSFVGVAVQSLHDTTGSGRSHHEHLIRMAFEQFVQSATKQVNEEKRDV